uniref:YKT6 v-SNARE homolog n=1 Tax=Athene cunicularia TaxID=194338 RepID=A0A663N2F3_ATHCN
MRLYSLSVLYKGDPKVHLLKAAYDVSTFNFFQRASVQEFMTFTSQLIVERSGLGSRASVKEQEYLCHVYVRNDGLAGVVIADNEYPQRVCFTLLDKVLDEFSRQVSKIDWPSGSPATISYAALDGYLSKYQVRPSVLRGGWEMLPMAPSMGGGSMGDAPVCAGPLVLRPRCRCRVVSLQESPRCRPHDQSAGRAG